MSLVGHSQVIGKNQNALVVTHDFLDTYIKCGTHVKLCGERVQFPESHQIQRSLRIIVVEEEKLCTLVFKFQFTHVQQLCEMLVGRSSKITQEKVFAFLLLLISDLLLILTKNLSNLVNYLQFLKVSGFSFYF